MFSDQNKTNITKILLARLLLRRFNLAAKVADRHGETHPILILWSLSLEKVTHTHGWPRGDKHERLLQQRKSKITQSKLATLKPNNTSRKENPEKSSFHRRKENYSHVFTRLPTIVFLILQFCQILFSDGGEERVDILVSLDLEEYRSTDH